VIDVAAAAYRSTSDDDDLPSRGRSEATEPHGN
jgi:hypothetical protein